MALDLEIVADVHATLGEGPLWDAEQDCLYWLDIDACALHRFDGRHDRVAATFGAPLGAAVLARPGRLLLGLGLQAAEVGPLTSTHCSPPVRVLASVTRGERINDGACDPRGRFFFGTKSAERGGAALYRLDPDGSIETVLDGATISNGLDWSPDDSTMYYVDTSTRAIDAFDYGAQSGTLSDRRRFTGFDGVAGNPDGLTVDSDGRLWVAMAHGGAVRCYEPSGRLAEVIELPVSKVTSVAFGGAALDELYITSGSWGFTDDDWHDQPHAGALFRCRPGVRGRLPNRFGVQRPPTLPD